MNFLFSENYQFYGGKKKERQKVRISAVIKGCAIKSDLGKRGRERKSCNLNVSAETIYRKRSVDVEEG